ncbi:hypothetical protein C8J30_102328 [Rhodobacter viridis]|uniref:Uncharacterized protein n=1 Tax=Rhodobacter viridis TaxID=1054202 RepID=A0A318U9I2_9RHOB|nr:hypothetical protein [Rhodobacter viridis]PYF12013.1 hypothetical protein C8J30_102328 [Rhodobacter viridis]
MATYEEIMRALRNAHNAGDVSAAKRLAAMAMRAAADQMAPEGPEVVATTQDGGRVYRGTGGALSFSSPAYATSDPDKIAEIMKGATPASQSQASFQDAAIADHPVAARAAKFVQGVPFAGEYADEAIGAMFGGKAEQATRYTQQAMQDRRPVQSTALQVAGGVAGAVPMAMAAAPAAAGVAGPTAVSTAIRGAAAGAALGATEGAISGYGAGNDGDRGLSAIDRGLMGAGVGGAVGGLAPAASSLGAAAFRRLKGIDYSTIARELGISSDAAKVVKTALEADDYAAAEAAIQRAGGKAMLADAGPATQSLLDASVNAGGASQRVVRDAVTERAKASAADMTATLDRTLGAPQGAEGIKSGIRQGTEAARSTAYDAAYSAPINYASERGQALKNMFARVPASAWRKANDLMALEGEQSKQILVDIADDGSVKLRQLPDVRQLDYVTRALNDVADAADGAGKMGGTTAVGRATSGLSRAIRQHVRDLVPEYGAALDTAADAISRTKASDLGYSMLRPGTTREAVRTGLAGASKAERDAAKAGVRSYIDDTLANVARTASDPNTDIRELQKLMREMTSRAAEDKMTALLGKADAAALIKRLDTETTSIELRAALAQNSKTAVRQSVQGQIEKMTAPGAMSVLLQGKPLEAGKRVAAVLSGQTEEAIALRQQGIYADIARALTEKRGNEASRAMIVIQRAMRGQPVTDAQAELIGRALAHAVAVGGYAASTPLRQ